MRIREAAETPWMRKRRKRSEPLNKAGSAAKADPKPEIAGKTTGAAPEILSILV